MNSHGPSPARGRDLCPGGAGTQDQQKGPWDAWLCGRDVCTPGRALKHGGGGGAWLREDLATGEEVFRGPQTPLPAAPAEDGAPSRMRGDLLV